MRSISTGLALAIALHVTLAGWGVPLAAQQSPLDDAEAMVASGRTEDARARLTAWWTTSAGARGAAARVEMQRALWLRGVLTVDPAQAALDYQRLVVEFPGGRWSDPALLRLAEISLIDADSARARDQLGALLRDYPTSALRADAERLLERVGRAGSAARPAAAEPPVTADEPPPTGSWTVQVGAFANPDRARAVAAEMQGSGIDSRLAMVPGSPLIRVRTGRFSDEDQAQALRRGLLARGFDATVSRDADREEAVP